MSIYNEKLEIAEDIIKLSKELGFNQTMGNGRVVTKEILAESHTLSELRANKNNLLRAKERRG